MKDLVVTALKRVVAEEAISFNAKPVFASTDTQLFAVQPFTSVTVKQ